MFGNETILHTLSKYQPENNIPLVNDLMTPNVVLVSRMETATYVMKLLIKNGISAAPVIDEHGAVVGLISDLDLLVIGALNHQDRKIGELPLKISIEKKLIRVSAKDSIKEALIKIIKHQIGRVVVVNDRRHCVGILSRKDIVKYFIARGFQG